MKDNPAIPLAILAVVTLVAGNALYSGIRTYDKQIKERQR